MSDVLTARRLNRATLARQLLLQRAPLDVVTAVQRVVALQAQEPASPYVALWNRVAGFSADDLDTAFREQSVVKATLLRITLHAVAADDHPRFQSAMISSLRASCLGDDRFTRAGLSVEEVDDLAPSVLAFVAEPRTTAELEGELEGRLGPLPRNSLWWALRRFLPVVHAPTGGPWTFGTSPAYVVAPAPADPDRDASLRWLLRRCLEGFGPASVLDLAQLTLLPRSAVRDALTSFGDELVRYNGPDGAVLYDVPGAPLPHEDVPAPPRLLGMWDSTLLAYADRGRLLPPDLRPHVVRRNGDVLPTLLVDGYVAGVWRPVEDGIEVTAYRPLPDRSWDAVAGEASALRMLLDRDPGVYRRFAHWWEKLPDGELRLL